MLNPDVEQEGEGEFYYNQDEINASGLESGMDMAELQDSLPDESRFGDPDPDDEEDGEDGMEDGTAQ